jgi:3-hydroxyacyl-[acyl-carrier-protein] dehydratase
MYSVTDIQKIIPHRFPMLLVDRIIEIEPQKRAVGIKNVTINEDFFNGHFPGKPVMPGVLLIEAMAQVGGIAMLDCDAYRGKLAFFAGIDNAKFRRPVVPGDQLRMEAEIVKMRANMGKIEVKAYVDGHMVAEADLMFALQTD